ncbi:hypothetical protein LCGC14_0252030 [marine sediment metagenome]|uniref:Uncharacterized protein n=1 Tax=marine sediment metagenome TaxID=412755 RepID=A0A0F9WPM2_9ZZZZ
MPRVNLNLTEAESLKPIPEDAYPATVMECGELAEGPKAHYVPVKVAISEGECEGRTFYVNLPIEGKGAGIFVDFINKCLDTDYDVDDLEELAFDTDELIGAELIINIKNEEYPKGSGDIRSGVKSTARAA